jgi:hypothetical protein
MHPEVVKRAGSLQGFSVVLVQGDMSAGTGIQDSIPPAAKKALADMKEFLPYKGYRLLDVQWTLCCGAEESEPSQSRLRGPDGRDFALALSTRNTGSRLSVNFVLRDLAPAGVGVAGEGSAALELHISRAAAEKRLAAGSGGPVDQNRDLALLQSRLDDARLKFAEARERRSPFHNRIALIDTMFTMDVGETVVVGTSRLAGGENALIALLTAVSKGAASK